MPRFEVDRTGATKARTLEFFALDQSWYSAKEFCTSPTANEFLGLEALKTVEMRLLRYARVGLLKRRTRERGYEYSISLLGEERLVYLWERLGYLNESAASTAGDREVLRSRLKLAAFLAGKHSDERSAKLRRLGLGA